AGRQIYESAAAREHVFGSAYEDDLAHSKIPEPFKAAEVGRLIAKTLAQSSDGTRLRQSGIAQPHVPVEANRRRQETLNPAQRLAIAGHLSTVPAPRRGNLWKDAVILAKREKEIQRGGKISQVPAPVDPIGADEGRKQPRPCLKFNCHLTAPPVEVFH